MRWTSCLEIRTTQRRRRWDIGEIELTCENTNTALPHIDLVNEILEQAVAPNGGFLFRPRATLTHSAPIPNTSTRGLQHSGERGLSVDTAVRSVRGGSARLPRSTRRAAPSVDGTFPPRRRSAIADRRELLSTWD